MPGINVLRELARIYIWARPNDPNNVAGYGAFTFPDDYPLARMGPVHDFYFSYAEECKLQGRPLDAETRNEADIKLFRGWVFIAMNQSKEELKLKIMEDVCLFWPVARDIGKFLWEGPKEENV